ncbi:PAS fold-containing protein [Pustulibacterium marinum]|uniref:PAS fold-containing protein n=1 Tax=Pustulibacterium marinum TaxID=1224947 RepID=A0A1I7ET77_9FLAO|nr:LuxR C-terminal-related transcriptional regulator [Pustulibacterium marinum]SFU27147.1 PAS fold-containing protein [Pustulibacterium marinum]
MNFDEQFKVYKEIFSKYTKYDGSVVQQHIEKLTEMDKIIPPMESYTMLLNVTKNCHEFLSKNFEYVAGYTVDEVKRNGGVEFIISKFHPNDITEWMTCIKELMDIMIHKVPNDKKDKISASYNYRLQKKNGEYINIIEYISPIYFDENNVPVIGFAHCTVIGRDFEYPIIGNIRMLNDAGEYETLFHKNFSHESLRTKLTNREIDVLRLIALRKTSKEIGEKLCISSHTVDSHRRKILKKMKFKSTGEIIQYCKENFLI